MYCPVCRTEFEKGVTECSDCHVDLVDELPPDPAFEEIDLATVFQSGDEAVIGLAESILNGADIAYISKGEGAHGLFGLAPMEIQVPVDRAQEAKDLLANLPQGIRIPSDAEELEE